MAWAFSWALHMVSFENFVKSMPPSLTELKVTPSFCFPFKIPDDPTATNNYIYINILRNVDLSKVPDVTRKFNLKFTKECCESQLAMICPFFKEANNC